MNPFFCGVVHSCAFALVLAGCEKKAVSEAPKAEVLEEYTAAMVPSATASSASAGLPAAPTGAAVASTTASVIGADAGTVAPGSTETMALSAANTKIAFTGSKVGGAHNGSFGKAKGEIKLQAKLEDSQISIEVEVASLHTDSTKLDEHLRSEDFFDAKKFPKATFKSTSIVEAPSKTGTHQVTGVLEIKGVRKTLKFPAKIERKESGVAVRADFVISRKGFHVDSEGLTDYLIKDEVLMGITITPAK
jgi:polyisoprenoid-binding protein YceI